jgi:membrane-associated protease RseP (regulator of RpoE activity)
MGDIMSILSSAYSVAPQSLISPGDKFTKVDPTKYQGTWTGKDYTNQPFTISITKVSGYRANVTFQSAAGLQYQRALITTKGTFRIGDSQFKLTGTGVAQINTIVTDPTTGIQTNQQSVATLQK